MRSSGTTAGSVLRLSVISDDRRLDVTVPSQVPLVEIIPGFARSLGVLDPALTHGGYALHRADGTTLDPARSAGVQNVHDGELLTLVRGGLVSEPRVYDDVVEAVIDATAEQHGEWTPRDSSRTALFISLTFLALCALLLLAAGSATVIPMVIALSGAVVLASAAAVLLRVGQHEAGHALGLAGALFGGVAGYLAVPPQDIWGWPLAAASLGMIIVGGFALAITRDKPEIHLVPVTLGAVVGIAATAAALLDNAVAPYALMLAISAALSNGIPWLALSSTRIKAISPQSDADMFADPEPIDGDEVKARAASGTRSLIALRLALGVAALAATPLLATRGVAGALLCGFAFLGMMFQSRQIHARLGVVVLMAMGAAGLALTGLTIVLGQPDLRFWLLGILMVASILLVGLTLLAPKARIRLARYADGFEVIALALLLPLGVITGGLL